MKRVCDHSSSLFWAIPIILMFELEIKRWSEIRLNLPTNRTYYQFYVNEDAILNVVTFARIDEDSNRPLKLRTASLRIPLRKPDKLIIYVGSKHAITDCRTNLYLSEESVLIKTTNVHVFF